MPTGVTVGLGALAAYLLGAVPFGLLVTRTRGIDIRKVGSGNIGATNVFRSVSKGLGILTFVLDTLKGLLPALLLPWALRHAGIEQLPHRELMAVIFGCSAVVGHNWPVYIGFKGGKGVATTAGALVGIAPAAVGVGLLAWVTLLGVTRYVSVASIASSLIVAAAGWFLYRADGLLQPVVLTLLAAALIWRHKANIQRLVNGTENRFSFGRKKTQPPPAGGSAPS